MNTPTVGMNDPVAIRHLTWSNLLAQSYRLYRERFWKLFCVALLPYMLAYIASFFFGFAFRQIQRMHIMTLFPPSFAAYATIYILGWIQGALYWAISGFFFAAVANNILVDAGEPGPALSDAFTQARMRIVAVISVALICWTLFWVGQSVANFALLPITNRLLDLGGPYFGMVDAVISLLIAGLLSRFGLAIPRLMQETGASVRDGLRFSVNKTENWEPFFMMFLAKSAILVYLVSTMATYAVNWLWHNGTLNTNTVPWATKGVYIAIIAALGSPLFIAFSLLYRESTRSLEDALSAAAAAIE